MNHAVLCLMACAVVAVVLDPPIDTPVSVWMAKNVVKNGAVKEDASGADGPKSAPAEIAPFQAAPASPELSKKAAARDVTNWDTTARKAIDGDWQASDGDNERLLQDAVEAGNEDGVPLYPCRGSYKGGVQLGRMRADFRGCHIGYDGHEIEVAPYETLTVTWAEASFGEVPPGASPAGASPMLSANAPFRVVPLMACRAAWRGNLQIGEVRDGGCAFGFGGQQVVADRYEVLMASPWMTWAPAVPLALGGLAIAGGNENGDKLYVCRAAAAGGLHIGKIKQSASGCSVPDGRGELVAKRFELLIPRWRTGTEGTLPVSAMPQGRENGNSQYLCRAQRNNSVQIGKVSGNQAGCHIGMQGGEVVVPVYDVLGE